MLQRIFYTIITILFFSVGITHAQTPTIPLMKAPIHSQDFASLQRGAKLYVNFCQGCHSLQYVRYSRLAEDLKITDRYGRVDTQTVKENLIFTNSKISDVIESALSKEDAKQWFGTTPPDLSLIARSRGVNWLYTYLLSFYQDDRRPWGVNNLVFKDVGMPNVLESLQGVQNPVYDGETISGVELAQAGSMQPEAFKQAVTDIVNFLDYVGEPYKQERKRLGLWVIGFLLILLVLTYFLKRAYWKDIH